MLESEETKKYMDKEFIIHVVDITLVFLLEWPACFRL